MAVTVAAELVDATKKYGQVEALRGVSLTIQLGEVVAMLGPNGAGKTTSISLLLGLRKPTSGSARLFGLEPTDIAARSRVGVMLQESGIPQMLKVREIVDLFRSYYPAPMPRDRTPRWKSERWAIRSPSSSCGSPGTWRSRMR